MKMVFEKKKKKIEEINEKWTDEELPNHADGINYEHNYARNSSISQRNLPLLLFIVLHLVIMMKPLWKLFNWIAFVTTFPIVILHKLPFVIRVHLMLIMKYFVEMWDRLWFYRGLILCWRRKPWLVSWKQNLWYSIG